MEWYFLCAELSFPPVFKSADQFRRNSISGSESFRHLLQVRWGGFAYFFLEFTFQTQLNQPRHRHRVFPDQICVSFSRTTMRERFAAARCRTSPNMEPEE